MASVPTPGKFIKTLTVAAADTPTQLSPLMIAAQPGAWIHCAELNLIGVAGSTVYIGDSSMASPGAGLPPVNYIWALDGDSSTPYNSGGGRDVNMVHCGDYWVMGLAINQKFRCETIVR
jgi:hypothetical protein